MKWLLFIFVFIFPYFGVQSSGILANQTFKLLKSYLDDSNIQGGLYLLRNKTIEMVGLDKELSFFMQGYLEVKNKEYKSALRSFKKIRNLKKFENHIIYYSALSYFYLGQTKNAQKIVSALLEKKDQETSEFFSDVLFLQARLNLKNKKYKQARKGLLTVLSRWRRSKTKKEKVLHEYLSHMPFFKNKKTYCDFLERVYAYHPNLEEAQSWSLSDNKVQYGKQYNKCRIGDRARLARLKRLYRTGKHAHLKKEFEEKKLDLKLQENYAYLKGEMKQALKFSKKQKPLVNKKKDQAKYHYYLGEYENYIAVQRQIEKEPGYKDQALYKQAQILFRNLHVSQAQSLFKKLLNQTRISKRLKQKAQYNLAWSFYLDGKYEEAYSAFMTLMESKSLIRGIKKEQLKYWMARTLERSGNINSAAHIYKDVSEDLSNQYYSLLSALRLEKMAKKQNVPLSYKHFLTYPWEKEALGLVAKRTEFLNGFKLASRLPSAFTAGPNPLTGIQKVDVQSAYGAFKFQQSSFSNSDFYQRFLWFARMGLFEKASFEFSSFLYKDYVQNKSNKIIKLGQFLQIKDFYKSSILASPKLYISSGSDQDLNQLWKWAYPQAYHDKVEVVKTFSSTPKFLIWSIMRAESFFNPKAESYVGARGLMQIMPETGQKVLALSPLVNLKKLDLYKPYHNIQIGSLYLERLLKVFKNQTPLAIAAYNGGPHRVKMWVTQFGSLSMDEFIEMIPFRETQGYVKKVVNNLSVYSALYGDGFDMSELTRPLSYKFQGPFPTSENWATLDK